MAKRSKPVSEQRFTGAAVASAAVAGAAAAGVGAFLWSRRGRTDDSEDSPPPQRDVDGEVSFVDDGVQGY